MNRFKKIISTIIIAAMIFSITTIMPMTVSANSSAYYDVIINLSDGNGDINGATHPTEPGQTVLITGVSNGSRNIQIHHATDIYIAAGTVINGEWFNIGDNGSVTITGNGVNITVNAEIRSHSGLTIKGTIGNITSKSMGIVANGNLTISGKVGNITAADIGIHTGRDGNLTISGEVGNIISASDSGLVADGDITISGKVGDITGYIGGSKLTISGKVGNIVSTNEDGLGGIVWGEAGDNDAIGGSITINAGAKVGNISVRGIGMNSFSVTINGEVGDITSDSNGGYGIVAVNNVALNGTVGDITVRGTILRALVGDVTIGGTVGNFSTTGIRGIYAEHGKIIINTPVTISAANSALWKRPSHIFTPHEVTWSNSSAGEPLESGAVNWGAKWIKIEAGTEDSINVLELPDTPETDDEPELPTEPNQPKIEINTSIIEKALQDENPRIILDSNTGTILSENALNTIKDSGRVVEIELENGLTITIDPNTITNNARAIDMNFIITSSGNQIRNAGITINTNIPANALVLIPPTHGDYGFEVNIAVNAQMLEEAGLRGDNIRLFHIASDGTVTEKGRAVRNADGSITITISSASYYTLSDEDLTALNTQNTDNGNKFIIVIVIGIVTVIIAGGLAIILHKRKNK